MIIYLKVYCLHVKRKKATNLMIVSIRLRLGM